MKSKSLFFLVLMIISARVLSQDPCKEFVKHGVHDNKYRFPVLFILPNCDEEYNIKLLNQRDYNQRKRRREFEFIIVDRTAIGLYEVFLQPGRYWVWIENSQGKTVSLGNEKPFSVKQSGVTGFIQCVPCVTKNADET